jgi:hypothetical protein
VPDAAVRVDGVRELRAALKRTGVGLGDLKRANAAAAQLVVDAALPFIPTRSGRLRASVRPSLKAANRARVLAGGAAVPYAGPIHWGWPKRKITAQPFVAEAAQRTEAQWLELYRADIARIIDSVPVR